MYRITFIKFITLPIFVGLVFIILICPPASGKQDASPEIAIIVSIEGLNREGFNKFTPAFMNELARKGLRCETAVAIKANTIEAGEASLLTGCLPEEHQHYGYQEEVKAESILDVFAKAKLKMLVVDGSGGKLQGFARGDKEYLKLPAGLDDAEVLKQTVERINENHPQLVYIYLNDCRDRTLQADSSAYSKKLHNIDNALRNMADKLRDIELLDRACLVITAARSSSPSNMVPVIISSPGIKPGCTVDGMSVIDVAPTVCLLMGLKTPANSSGLVPWVAVQEQLITQGGPLSNRIHDLEQERVRMWQKYYEVIQARDRMIHEVEEMKEERENIFNYAGEKEKTIGQLRHNINQMRGLMTGLTVLFLIGYLVEYKVLRRRYLLFK